MLKIEQLDANVSHDDQIADASEGPVTLVNIFHVSPGDADAFVEMWGDVVREFKSSPGYISAQFHRGTAGSTTFLNYSVWESVGAYRGAFNNPTFRARIKDYPDSTVATPHLFRKEAIADVCVE